MTMFVNDTVAHKYENISYIDLDCGFKTSYIIVWISFGIFIFSIFYSLYWLILFGHLDEENKELVLNIKSKLAINYKIRQQSSSETLLKLGKRN